MRLVQRSLFVLLLASSAASAQSSTRDSLLVSPQWLAQHLKDADLVVLYVGAEDEYKKAHIPGSYYVQNKDVAVEQNAAGTLSVEMLAPEPLRANLGAFGITNRSHIVVYTGRGSQTGATRVIMTLDYAGFGKRTSLLNGGLPAWTKDGLALTDVVPAKHASKLNALTISPIVVNAEYVNAHRGKPGFSIVDARAGVFYAGVSVGGGASEPHRKGHIAGAKSVPYVEVFGDDGLKPTAELRQIFEKAGVAPGDTVIGYCHIGLQATAMLFAARALGNPIRFYDGSFEDWSRQPAATFPVEVPAPKPDGAPRTLVIPASLQTPQTTAVAEYLRVFSAGDITRMQSFIEQSMLPNPARTTEARIKSYIGLRDELGTLAIDSVSIGSLPNQTVVKTRGNSDKAAVLTFVTEGSAPYRIMTIDFKVGRPQ